MQMIRSLSFGMHDVPINPLRTSFYAIDDRPLAARVLFAIE